MRRTPFECPKCHGQGVVARPPWVAGDLTTWTSNDTGPYECKVCDGTGLIWEVAL